MELDFEIINKFKDMGFISHPKMYSFEKTKIISCRTQQLQNNGHSFLTKEELEEIPKTRDGEFDIEQIAFKELNLNVIPYLLEPTIKFQHYFSRPLKNRLW